MSSKRLMPRLRNEVNIKFILSRNVSRCALLSDHPLTWYDRHHCNIVVESIVIWRHWNRRYRYCQWEPDRWKETGHREHTEANGKREWGKGLWVIDALVNCINEEMDAKEEGRGRCLKGVWWSIGSQTRYGCIKDNKAKENGQRRRISTVSHYWRLFCCSHHRW